MNTTRSAICGLAVAGMMLSGCSGTNTTGLPSVLDAAAIADLVVETRTDVRALNSATPTFANLPTNSSATYTGYAIGDIKTSSGATTARNWIGDASIDAQFTTNSVSFEGEVTNIVAKNNVRAGNQPGSIAETFATGTEAEIEAAVGDYESTIGSITIANGRFAPGSQDRIRADVSGGFTHDGDELEFDGLALGYFEGDNYEALRVNGDTVSDELTITENGTKRAGDFGIQTVR
ncbi:hypothetical protein [uncultured Maritimibacter sp.]|jgi:hypothetical protein|uniref:hypothetical protein n=1 Tax=uncultured Maritimibacter sp. TaxID=991866 RepID=UPI002606917A|nr:hypothetical protein [uncultured Maritimibacter sp.]